MLMLRLLLFSIFMKGSNTLLLLFHVYYAPRSLDYRIFPVYTYEYLLDTRPCVSILIFMKGTNNLLLFYICGMFQGVWATGYLLFTSMSTYWIPNLGLVFTPML